MKLRDKVKEIEPELVNDKHIGGVSGCPDDYEYLEDHYVIDYDNCYEGSGCERCWSQEYIEEIEEIEEVDCDYCKHCDCSMYEEPCNKCKYSVSPNSEEYKTRPSLYEEEKEEVDEPKEVDNVNHPNHYQGKNECIDVMVAMFGLEAVKHFCMCNAYKYRFRADKKNGEEDIKKAEFYETKLIELGGVK